MPDLNKNKRANKSIINWYKFVELARSYYGLFCSTALVPGLECRACVLCGSLLQGTLLLLQHKCCGGYYGQ